VLPVINDYWERAEFPRPLIDKLAKLDIVGDGIEGYGCPPMSPIACGLIHLELNRGDGSLGTFRVAAAAVTLARGILPRLDYLCQPIRSDMRFATQSLPRLPLVVLIHGLARGGTQTALLLGRLQQNGQVY